ncbi:hypothetical protein E4U53_004366, partial [Claviceps sorghi]
MTRKAISRSTGIEALLVFHLADLGDLASCHDNSTSDQLAHRTGPNQTEPDETGSTRLDRLDWPRK